MAVFGGRAVESFAIPMIFGILVAASSSVFIAAPILLFLADWRRRRAPAAPDPTVADTHPAGSSAPKGGWTIRETTREPDR